MYGNNKWVDGETILHTKLNDMTLTSSNYFNQPDYHIANIEAVADTINTLRNENTFFMLFQTDQHASTINNYMDNVVALSQASNQLNPDCILIGGDLQDGATDKYKGLQRIRQLMQIIRSSINVPTLITKGNHDTNYYYAQPLDSLTDMFTNKEWYLNAVKHVEQYNVIRDSNNLMGGYYYLDFEQQKIRIICVNTCENEETDGVTTDFKFFNVSSQQYKWFAEEALNLSEKTTPSDWHVLVFSHSVPINNVDLHEYMLNDSVLSGACEAFVLGTQYTNATHDISIDYGIAGNFIGWLSGHLHLDKHVLNNNVNYAVLNCACPVKRWDDSVERAVYTITMNSISAIIIDTNTKTVNIKKIGTGTDISYSY